MAQIMMTPEGGVNTTGNYVAPTSSPGGTPGSGWQLTYTRTYSQLSGNVSDELVLPFNARELSVSYKYVGAGTVNVNISASNNTIQELGSGAATKFYAPVPTSICPQITGGQSQSSFFPSAPSAIQAVISGSGQSGSDVLTITMSAVSKINV